jgi:virulence factor Mce-like protein
MRPRRGQASVAATPVLVGAVTLLVVVVAVFLAYNANNGLPFVPTHTLYVDLPDGANLIKGDEVRQGGFRIGAITTLAPVRDRRGRTVARATAELDADHGNLPVDTRLIVRSRGLLGSKYLDVSAGHARRTFPDRATIPASQATVPVQFDDVANTFDARTRLGVQRVLRGLGTGVAARGEDLNRTFAALPALLPPLQRVMATLAAPRTNLHGFFGALDRTTRALAPVAGREAHLLAVAATTFDAVSRDRSAFGRTIDEGPRTLAVATPALRAQRPFLRHATALAAPLERSARELSGALGDLDAAVVAGTPASRRTPAFARRTTRTLHAVTDLGRDPATLPALTGIADTVDTLQPQIRYIGPFITVCNYWNYLWTLISDTSSVRNPVGQSLHALVAQAPNQTNDGLGEQGAKRPANGGAPPGQIGAYLHGQPWGAAVDADGTADCEQVQRGYPSRLASYAAPDLNVTMDSHTPGSQGPVFASLDDKDKPRGQRVLGTLRVPPGETYVRSPQTGPQLPPEPEGGP